MGNLATPLSVQKLQKALQAKAKESPEFRFYALYDKVYRADVLQYAYASCKANQGAAGVDGERFEDIEAYGEERWLKELAQELREKRYEAQAVRRVYIPKPNGKERPLSIPTIDSNCTFRQHAFGMGGGLSPLSPLAGSAFPGAEDAATFRQRDVDSSRTDARQCERTARVD